MKNTKNLEMKKEKNKLRKKLKEKKYALLLKF